MPQLRTWQLLSMCHQNSVRDRPENSLHQERTWVRLPAAACLFTFLYFRLITSKLLGLYRTLWGECEQAIHILQHLILVYISLSELLDYSTCTGQAILHSAKVLYSLE